MVLFAQFMAAGYAIEMIRTGSEAVKWAGVAVLALLLMTVA